MRPGPNRRRATGLLLAFLLLAVGLGACEMNPTYTTEDPVLKKPLDQLTDQDVARMAALVETNLGSFRIALRPDWSPKTVRHFIKLVRMGFYTGLSFHEVRQDLWILGGDPKGDGTGGPGSFFPFEPPVEGKGATHLAGRVGLHHPAIFPDKGGSIFYIMTQNDPGMDGKYALFGEVISGQAVIDRIIATPILGKRPHYYQPVSPVRIIKIKLEAKTK